jgi:hypothetical protein
MITQVGELKTSRCRPRNADGPKLWVALAGKNLSSRFQGCDNHFPLSKIRLCCRTSNVDMLLAIVSILRKGVINPIFGM